MRCHTCEVDFHITQPATPFAHLNLEIGESAMPPSLCAESATSWHTPPATHGEFPIRISVLDDHPIISAHLRSLLRPHRDLQVVNVSNNAGDTQKFLVEQDCDLLILDFLLPGERDDGAVLIKRLRRLHPHLAIVVLSAGHPHHVRHTAFRSGANAHISKTDSLRNLAALLREVCNRPDVFFHLENGIAHAGAPAICPDELTLNELEVVRRMASGLSVGQVAEQLSRSKKTISSHKRRAMKKLGIADDVALAIYLHEYQKSSR